MSSSLSSTRLYGANVRANGIRQHYVRFGGRGPALVLVPGIISPAALWATVGERLGRHFDTYIVDVRGRGLSEAGGHLDYGLDACATDVTQFAAALQLSNYTLLGHSLGARIGIRAARSVRGELNRLVLVDPPVSGPGRRPYPSLLAPILELIRAARAGDSDFVYRHPTSAHWPEAQRRIRAEWLCTCDERAVAESHRGLQEDDIHADLAGIEIPLALIAAGKGDVIRRDDEDELVKLCPRMKFLRVSGAGHQIQIDDAEGFFAALGSVFDRVL